MRTYLRFREADAAVEVVAQALALKEVQQQVEVVLVLEGAVHSADELRASLHQSREDASFLQDCLNALLGDDFGLVHDLERVDLPRFLVLHLPHLAEPALADELNQPEIVDAEELLNLLLLPVLAR